jgi:outer membrane protein, multidrug efflux system
VSLMLFRVLATGGLAASLLAACSLAPAYKPSATAEVANYKEAGDWMPAQPADAQQRGPWWEVFGDPKLNELEQQLDTANPDLQAAIARFEQARAVAREDVSNEFPTLDLGASGKRTRGSGNAPLGALNGNIPVTSNDFIASLNLNWEIDLFGRLRNTAAAARAQAQSSEADAAAVALSLQAELATDYFTLRGDDTTIALLEDTITVYDRAYDLTKNRYQEGISAATDVD